MVSVTYSKFIQLSMSEHVICMQSIESVRVLLVSMANKMKEENKAGV